MRFNEPFSRGIKYTKATEWDGTTFYGGFASNNATYWTPVFGQGTSHPIGFSKSAVLRLMRSVLTFSLSGSFVVTNTATGDTISITWTNHKQRLTFGENALFESGVTDEKTPVVPSQPLSRYGERLLVGLVLGAIHLNISIGQVSATSFGSNTVNASGTSTTETYIGALPYSDVDDVEGEIAGPSFVELATEAYVESQLSVTYIPTSGILADYGLFHDPESDLFYPVINLKHDVSFLAERINDPEDEDHPNWGALGDGTSIRSEKTPDAAQIEVGEISMLGQAINLYANDYTMPDYTYTFNITDAEITTEKFWEFRDSAGANPLYDIDTGAPL